MNITKKITIGAFALVLGGLLLSGNGFADDWITTRNLPVDPNFHQSGDRKFDERLYPKTDMNGFVAQNSIDPGRNLPVDVNYRGLGDRKYDEKYYPQTATSGFAVRDLPTEC